MTKLQNDQGTSLIWFSAVMALLVAAILVLACATHQYLFARDLKDYSEQLVLAALSLKTDFGDSKLAAERIFTLVPNPPESFEILSLESPDGRTLVLSSCALWQSRIAIVPLERKLCTKSSAR